MRNLLVLPLVLFLTACGVEIVDTGHRGVKTTFGEVVGESLPEGLYFYNPFSSDIIELDVRTLRWDHNTETYTKDVQQATINFTLNYALEAGAAHEIYRTVGREWHNVLLPQVALDAIKEVVGKWDAVDLIANRDRATTEIANLIKKRLADKHIVVSNFAINDLSYTKEFERSVEAKVVAIQRAIEEQNRTRQIEEQAKQKVLQAEAEAKSIRIRAQALESNPKLVEWEAVQKWDGKLPQYMLGNGVPLLNLK